jgi:glycosyltransferase involved in cell wall biosynthesis
MNNTKSQRWLTNHAYLPSHCDTFRNLDVRYCALHGTALIVGIKLFLRSLRYDVVILYQPPSIASSILCVLRWFMPISKPTLVFVDVVFNKPENQVWSQIKAFCRAILWKQVDLFLSHMVDVVALDTYYGIPRTKCRYIPFKVNSIEHLSDYAQFVKDEGYVFTGGKTRRDYDTFCHAMRQLPYRGMILTPQKMENAYHGTWFDESHIPENVYICRDDGSPDSWIKHMAAARIVVFAISSNVIHPAGVSAYLLAMALRKCVIITDCPATRNILENGKQAIIVRPEDPAALSAALCSVMEDQCLRDRIATCGHDYAIALGGERDLLQRIVDAIALHLRLNVVNGSIGA